MRRLLSQNIMMMTLLTSRHRRDWNLRTEVPVELWNAINARHSNYLKLLGRLVQLLTGMNTAGMHQGHTAEQGEHRTSHQQLEQGEPPRFIPAAHASASEVAAPVSLHQPLPAEVNNWRRCRPVAG